MTGLPPYLPRGVASPSGAGCWDRPEGSYSLFSLTAAAGLVLAAGFSQAAQETFDVYHDPAPGDGWYARVVIYNPVGSGTNTYTVETDLGPVVIQYFTLLNEPCNEILHDRPAPKSACADEIYIRSVPDGVVPSVWQALVHENGEATVFLSKWLGV